MTPLLQMRDIRKRFGATLALDGVDLEVAAGEVLALVGENGAGKSTLMKVLSGAHAPDAGEMFLKGKPYSPRSPLDARKSGVAMIYQELSLAPHMTVAENILLGLEPTRGPFLDIKALRQSALGALEEVGLKHVAPETIVAELSVAERQLVEIARAVALGSQVLVFDEPTSSLTQSDIRRLFALVNRLRASGHAIVYISHFLEEVMELSDRFTVLRDGKSVGGGITAQAQPNDIIALMVGRDVADLYPRSKRTAGEVALEISGLSGPDGKPKGANLQLRRGHVTGIAGLVGAGRTELMRVIFGLDAVKSGEIKVGEYSGAASPAQRWDQGVGMVSEDRKIEGLALELSIAENLTMTKIPTFFNPLARQQTAAKFAKDLSVKCASVGQEIGALSGGNQQKVAIARLLYHGAEVLLLDEPTRGIDVGSKAQIYRVIDELALSGKAILMISSYLPELLGTCDEIAVMNRGRLSEALPVSQVTEQSIMREATGAVE